MFISYACFVNLIWFFLSDGLSLKAIKCHLHRWNDNKDYRKENKSYSKNQFQINKKLGRAAGFLSKFIKWVQLFGILNSEFDQPLNNLFNFIRFAITIYITKCDW